MKIVADANAFFSCLIKDGLSRRIWFEPEVELFAPEFIRVEFTKYRTYLEEKYSGRLETFDPLVSTLLAHADLLSDDLLTPFLPAARTLVSDPKDWFYVAAALKVDAGIWTSDPHFSGQNRIPVFNSKQLASQLGLL